MSAAVRLWSRCRGWLRQSLNGRILSAMLTVGGFSLIVNAAIVVRELVLAALFGVGDDIDSFVIACALPAFGVNVLAGTIGSVLIPTFVRLREQTGRPGVQQLLSAATGASLAVAAVAVGILAAGGRVLLPWLASNFDADKLQLTLHLYYWLLPGVLLHTVNRVWAAALHAHEQFVSVALSPIIIPLISVGLLLPFRERFGILPMAWAACAGYLLEGVWIGISLRRLGYRLRPTWMTSALTENSFWEHYGALVGGAALASSTVLVSQSMTAGLAAGSVAALNYGNKLVTFLVSLGNLAVGTAVLPHFSRMVTQGDWGLVRRTLRLYGGLIVLITIPLVLVFGAASQPIVRLLYERGEFTSQDTLLVAHIQTLAFWQLPFQVLGTLGVRMLSACSRNGILLWISAGNLLVTVIANRVLISWMGVAGISLATSLVYAVSASLIFLALALELRNRQPS